MFFTILELALKSTSIWPLLNPLTVLLIITPITFMNCSISVNIYSKSTCLIVLPLSLKYITILICYLTLTIYLVIPPLTLVYTSIGKILSALTISITINPLSRIHTPRLKYNFRFILPKLSLNFLFNDHKKTIFIPSTIFLSFPT